LKRLKQLIKKSGLKKTKIAEHLGITPTWLSAILSGKVKPATLPEIKRKIIEFITPDIIEEPKQ
jgi:transcriptional regulator with XRE-family HTH domain